MNRPEVYIAGAGCGDASLLTQEVAALLKKAQIIIYDDLLDPDILNLAPQAETIYVGKRASHHARTQAEINQLLIDSARTGKIVVRLKGGDPFVFGRGKEEAEALAKAGIAARILPGLSSCIVIPERMGIPVTLRGVSEGFTVITAHTREGLLSDEAWKYYAKTTDTLVILMGLSSLKTISEKLIGFGMAASTPAAVLSSPRIHETQGAAGTLEDIAARAASLSSPAIIVIGPVVNEADFSKKPPFKVGFTGTSRLRTKLQAELGESAAVLPLMEAVPSPSALTYSDFLAQKELLVPEEETCWLAFTSPYGSQRFLELLKQERIDYRDLHGMKIACIGKATAEPFEKAGLYPDFIPGHSTTAALGQELPADGTTVFTFRESEASEVLEDTLLEQGHPYARLNLYTSRFEEQPVSETPDVLVFASSSAVHHWMEHHPDTPAVPVIAISEVTAEALKEYGISALIAEDISAAGLARTIAGLVNRAKNPGSQTNQPS